MYIYCISANMQFTLFPKTKLDSTHENCFFVCLFITNISACTLQYFCSTVKAMLAFSCFLKLSATFVPKVGFPLI